MVILVETRVIQPKSDAEQHPSYHCSKATFVANTLHIGLRTILARCPLQRLSSSEEEEEEDKDENKEKKEEEEA